MEVFIYQTCRFCGRTIKKSELGTDPWVHEYSNKQECPPAPPIATPLDTSNVQFRRE